MSEKKTRRNFLTTIGTGIGIGLTAGLTGPLLLKSEAAMSRELPPWPYRPMYPEAIAKKASDNFLSMAEYEALKGGYGVFTGMCCNEAAIEAIVKSAGYAFPPGILSCFGGGVAGWGCLCGAVTGCLTAIGCFHGKVTRDTKSGRNTFPMAQRLMEWTTKNAGAPCCHVSVTTRSKNEGWNGTKWGNPDHYRSCALWTGRVVEKTINILNDEYEGKFEAYSPPDYTQGCAECHSPMTGLSNCNSCHDEGSYKADPHKHAPVAEILRNPKQPDYLKQAHGWTAVKEKK